MGSRLRSVTGDLPKPLVDVCGEPLLGRQLGMVAASSITDVVLLCGYGAAAIADYCGDGSKWGLDIRCVVEAEARGTAGAVSDAIPMLQPNFLVMYGDVVLDVDLDRLMAAHAKASPAATLLAHPNDHPYDSDIVEADGANFVTAIHGYPHPPGLELRNLVNAGLYVLERDALAGLTGLPSKPDFGKHVFARMLAEGLRLYAYRSPEYIKDAGTPARLEKVSRDILSGRVAALSLRHPTPAIFIDRDGVLNEERGHISRPDDLVLLPGAAQAVAKINRSSFRSVVITNQPVVARGDCSVEELERIHARLDTRLAEDGAFVDALYYCPHHPDAGFPGEVPALKITCQCRKPAAGLIEQAAAEMNIDLGGSWFIGDSTTDMELARRLELRFVLVETGYGGRDGKFAGEPAFTVPHVAAAVDLILAAGPPSDRRP
jgi:histidinol-phosphate phosphatase family protein